ncbi:unnamed protein product [Allacma fusca]|uniref:Corticotropin-releasing factor domain-containing protein n=1 Tax=Allacma fusca TaxID=39272 RepID=A0A8J2JGD5_9HEXA|nr:unnamed protein product [Allacma fusca]
MTRLSFSLRPVSLVLFIIIGILHLSSVSCKAIPKRSSAPVPPGVSSESLDYTQLNISSSSLSIVSPLEVLRQTMAAEVVRSRIREAKNRRLAINNEYLRKVGR